jgi:hypothetical protein
MYYGTVVKKPLNLQNAMYSTDTQVYAALYILKIKRRQKWVKGLTVLYSLGLSLDYVCNCVCEGRRSKKNSR